MTNLFATNDGIKGGTTSDDVVRLDSKHFTKGEGGTKTEESPHFHFSETLSSDLRPTSERLLIIKLVQPNRTHVNLVLHHVVKLQDIHVSNGSLLSKFVASKTITKLNLSVFWKTSRLEFSLYVTFVGTSKWCHDSLIAESVCSHTKVKLENLSKVHTRRHTKWCKEYVNWTPVFGVWHIFFWKNTKYNTLVSVTTS